MSEGEGVDTLTYSAYSKTMLACLDSFVIL